jgi:hypothetical protein
MKRLRQWILNWLDVPTTTDVNAMIDGTIDGYMAGEPISGMQIDIDKLSDEINSLKNTVDELERSIEMMERDS